jgi:hypothetical protein
MVGITFPSGVQNFGTDAGFCSMNGNRLNQRKNLSRMAPGPGEGREYRRSRPGRKGILTHFPTNAAFDPKRLKSSSEIDLLNLEIVEII